MNARAPGRWTAAALLAAMLATTALADGLAGLAGPGGHADTDGDGIDDAHDNCITAPNGGQRDADGDGFGNACDTDLDNDGIVDAADLALFRARLATADPAADFNGSGVVNAVDLSILRAYFGRAPGPSATPWVTPRMLARASLDRRGGTD